MLIPKRLFLQWLPDLWGGNQKWWSKDRIRIHNKEFIGKSYKAANTLYVRPTSSYDKCFRISETIHENPARRSQNCSALGKQEKRSVERGYLSHCRNSVENCFPTQNFTEIGQWAAELWLKTILNMAAVRHLEFKILFYNWPLDCHRVPNQHLCTKFYLKNRMIFLFKYGDLTILNMAAILNFRGPRMRSLKSPCRTSYWSSAETITLNRIVF